MPFGKLVGNPLKIMLGINHPAVPIAYTIFMLLSLSLSRF